MSMWRSVALTAVGAIGAFSISGCAPKQPWTSNLVSVNARGSDSAALPSEQAVMSPDGTKVAFVSSATDIVTGDNNGQRDVFVRDLEAGTTTLVSVNAAGASGGSGHSDRPIFSPDSSKVMFTTTASDLGATDTNGNPDVYVRNLDTQTTTLVSVNLQGTAAGNAGSAGPVFSPDGTKVAFASGATDLVTTPLPYTPQVYLRDLVANSTSLVSVNASGTAGSNLGAHGPVYSPDGTKIAFVSRSNDLGHGDYYGLPDIYVRDLTTAATTLVSEKVDGSDAGGGSSESPVFSADSRYIAFMSWAPDLVPVDTNGTTDIFVRDLSTSTTQLVSANAANTDSGNGSNGYSLDPPFFSPLGHYVAWVSYASNLGPTDTNGDQDVYLRNIDTGVTTLVSANADNTDSSTYAGFLPAFNPDGTSIAFVSRSSNLGITDTNGYADIYVRSLTDYSITLLSTNASGTDSNNGGAMYASFSADGTKVAFISAGSDFGPTDTNTYEDVYVARYLGP